jgi:hypothetical protein
MAAKNAHEAARKKSAKQKKILIVLCVPMLISLVFAYHTVSKLHASVAPQVVAPAGTPSGTSAPGTGTTPATTVPVGSPVSETVPIPLTTSPDTGKLAGLSLLAAKDPFFDGGPHVAAATSTTQGTSKPDKQKVVPPTAAVISVNGKVSAVTVGAAFPVSKDSALNGVFRLVSLTAKTAKIAVVGGSYTNGSNTLTLTLGSVVTLVNTANGRKYTLVLYPPGTPVPGATQTTTTTGP